MGSSGAGSYTQTAVGRWKEHQARNQETLIQVQALALAALKMGMNSGMQLLMFPRFLNFCGCSAVNVSKGGGMILSSHALTLSIFYQWLRLDINSMSLKDRPVHQSACRKISTGQTVGYITMPR